MKSRVVQELTEEYKYALFEELMDDAMAISLAVILYWQHLRRAEQTKAYRVKKIQEMFEDFIATSSLPNICGKELQSEELIEFLQKEYSIDFDRIHMNKETKADFDKRKPRKR